MILPSNGTHQASSSGIARHVATWFAIEGVVLLVLGALAVIVPMVAGLAVAVVLGWLLLVAGVVGLFATSRARGLPGFGWALISALLALAAGIVLLRDPWAGLLTLTVVLTAYFIADGISTVVRAVVHRRQLTGKWEWMLVNGLADLVIAAAIVAGLPGTLTWVLGLLVGLDMIMAGAALIAMAMAARKAVP